MRTTFTLDKDVAAEIERLRRDEGLGLSEAVNRLARAGMSRPKRRVDYRHRTADLGLRVDVTDIGGVLDILEPAHRRRGVGARSRLARRRPDLVPPASERTAAIYGQLARSHNVTANLVADAMLAALALEHGLTVMSTDSDFARFPEVPRHNPLAG